MDRTYPFKRVSLAPEEQIAYTRVRIVLNTASVSPKPQKSRLLIPQWEIRILAQRGADVGRF